MLDVPGWEDIEGVPHPFRGEGDRVWLEGLEGVAGRGAVKGI